MQPIWKDCYVTLPYVSNGTPYQIQCDNDIVFSGIAFPRPGETVPRVRINDICADFLENHFPLEEADHPWREFHVNAFSGGEWEGQMDVDFYRDWSYDRAILGSDYTDRPLHAPIVDYIHPLQYVPLYTASGGYWDVSVYSPGGIIDETETGQDAGLSYCPKFYRPSVWGNLPAGTIVADEEWDPLVIWKVADLCGGYVLYYINAYGVWDTLPVTGKAVRSDGYTRHTRNIVYDNGTATARGTKEYANEIAVSWRLHITGLTQEQASRMHHLIGSAFVYLHDIEKDEIHPVIINERSLEYKQDSGKLHTFSFNVNLAQERLRR